MATVSGEDIALSIGHAMVDIGGRQGHAVGINGGTPGPVIRLKEGQKVRLAVSNMLKEESSIHWHGLLVPFAMDEVPGITFPGIPARSRFVHEFPVVQSGTYWAHSHSGFQEQEGLYLPVVIDPVGPDPVAADREHVVMLSDFAFVPPARILQRLKQESGGFNYQRQTVAGLLRGRDQPFRDRVEWARMLMDPTDIADVTGAVYTYLVNGMGPRDNWTGLFKPGEKVRLRFINAGAQTIFDVRIPGLALTIVDRKSVV